MKAWIHRDHAAEQNMIDVDLDFLNAPAASCQYCGHCMETSEIQDLWQFSPEQHLQTHATLIDFDLMIREEGLSPSQLELRDGDPGEDVYCHASVCKICGWWVLQRRALLSARESQVWEQICATSGRLANLDLTDMRVPIEEVRKYLCARYEARFSLHPKKFEEVVASVFSDLGYDSRVTTYSNDGGIDVLLCGSHDRRIGIQVKRYKRTIAVEQIRALLGALVVNNCVAGIFVTTSAFQKGAAILAQSCRQFRPIELMDANRFLEALQVAQFNSLEDGYPLSEFERAPKISAVAGLYLNSL
jgi:restriction system protein